MKHGILADVELSGPEFEATLSLKAVSVSGGQSIDFLDDDERLRWDDTVVVISLDGTEFTEVHADVLG